MFSISVNRMTKFILPSVLILFCFINNLTKLKLGGLILTFSLMLASTDVAISDKLAVPLLLVWCWISKTFTGLLLTVHVSF